MDREKFTPLIGAHLSIADGLDRAVFDAHTIGATTMQIFTAAYRQWHSKLILEEQVEKFREAVEKTSIKQIMSHASYLINLGSPKEDVRTKSIGAFSLEIERCLQLQLRYLNFHPGAALDASKEICMDAIIEALLQMKSYFSSSSTLEIILENAAGQGSCVGATFEELSYILNGVKNEIPVGICLDTCHLFAAGYDIRSKSSLEAVLEQFDEIVGLKYLKAMHLNDSENECGSRKDRHSLLGKGLIGKEAFIAIMSNSRLYDIPKYLETPGDLPIWRDEIAWLKSQIPIKLAS